MTSTKPAAELVVRTIIDTKDGYSRVVVSNETFRQVQGVRPELPYKAMGDMGGNGVRIFSFGTTELYVKYDKENRKSIFIMKASDVKKHLRTLEQEREGEEKLPFNAAQFATSEQE